MTWGSSRSPSHPTNTLRRATTVAGVVPPRYTGVSMPRAVEVPSLNGPYSACPESRVANRAGANAQ